MKAIKVKNHRAFACFEYTNYPNENFELGQILYKNDEFNGHEIGVIIQLHEDGDCRTDMWGNCSKSEVSFATIEQVKQYRPEIL